MIGQPHKNLVGQRFGRLVAVKMLPRKKGQEYFYWQCQCDCGKIKNVEGSHLRHGTRSCGCLRGIVNTKIHVTHGMSRTPEHRAWARIHTRCYNKKQPVYEYYGARGIRVCLRWQGEGGFVNFLVDMGRRPSDKHSIDRKNVNGHYTPRNCCWSLPEQQFANRRSTRWTRVDGLRVPLKKACQIKGLNYYSTRSKMIRKNLSFAQAARALLQWQAGPRRSERRLKKRSIVS